ncbi:unnamed protein product [Dibothriocephalus latus]|uniref:Uncharacterized protein n=1 Tax=Dibothriocephalus latus TaxID=60516 RepID=A0A3P7LR32_DIBLA|nr:unnamed protein product [Dibothriocephalus latus]
MDLFTKSSLLKTFYGRIVLLSGGSSESKALPADFKVLKQHYIQVVISHQVPIKITAGTNGLQVLNRQRTEFTKTRKFLKTKWKADVKRMVDAESALFKSKAAYFSRCQTGVKLREELATAQSLLNEMQANLVGTYTSAPPISPLSPGAGASGPAASGAEAGSSMESGLDGTAAVQTLMNQVAKQKAKVERLEKQLAENDKKVGGRVVLLHFLALSAFPIGAALRDLVCVDQTKFSH